MCHFLEPLWLLALLSPSILHRTYSHTQFSCWKKWIKIAKSDNTYNLYKLTFHLVAVEYWMHVNLTFWLKTRNQSNNNWYFSYKLIRSHNRACSQFFYENKNWIKKCSRYSQCVWNLSSWCFKRDVKKLQKSPSTLKWPGSNMRLRPRIWPSRLDWGHNRAVRASVVSRGTEGE